MKLTPHAEALLRQVSDWQHEPALMRELRGLREAAALPELAVLLFADDSPTAEAAREAAAGTLSTLNPRALPLIEQVVRLRGRGVRVRRLREQPWFTDFARFYAELPEWRLREVAAQPFGEVAAILGSFHSSGFVRQSAINLLAQRHDGVELPALLLRQNDWVPAVRETASAALHSRLYIGYVPHFLKSLFLVEQLLVYRRNDLTALHAAILALLKSPACRPLIEAACSDPNPFVSRAVCQLAVTDPQADVRAIVMRALHSPDLWLRVWAARTARTRLYGKPLAEALGRAKGDRSAPVRLEALYAFFDDYPELRAVLLDPSASIRAMARFYLNKKSSIDMAALYRDAVAHSSGRELAVALSALGESGGAADAALLLPHLAAQEVRVRRAAVRALGRLAGDAHARELVDALSDPQPGVCRDAATALSSRPYLLRGADLLSRLQRHPNPSARRRMGMLLGKLDRWQSIPLLLAAYADPSEQVRDTITAALTRILGAPGYVAPTPAEREALQNSLQAPRAHSLPAAIQRGLGDLLKLWR